MANKKDKDSRPALFIELLDGNDVITVPSASIYDIKLETNIGPAGPENKSKVTIIRINPDNSRSHIIAKWTQDKHGYHVEAAKRYYERITQLVGAIKLSDWYEPKPTDNTDPFSKL